MPRGGKGIELTISAGERPQTYALDRAATEMGITATVALIKRDQARSFQNLRGLTPLMAEVRVITFLLRPTC
jgi:hypothetical protein